MEVEEKVGEGILDFIRKYYTGILHTIMIILVIVVCVQGAELKDAKTELSKVKYITNTIFIQEAPKVKNKEERIMTDYAIKKYSKKYGVDEALIRSIIKHESNFNSTAMSSVGCIGLMQISPDKAIHPFDIEENVEAGTKYMAHLIKKYHGNVRQALHAYNAGIGNVARGTVPKSTYKYANKILSDKGKV